jgi:hypothetical protein
MGFAAQSGDEATGTAAPVESNGHCSQADGVMLQAPSALPERLGA